MICGVASDFSHSANSLKGDRSVLVALFGPRPLPIPVTVSERETSVGRGTADSQKMRIPLGGRHLMCLAVALAHSLPYTPNAFSAAHHSFSEAP